MDAFGTDTIATYSDGHRHLLISGRTNSTPMLKEIRKTRDFLQRHGGLPLYGSVLLRARTEWIYKRW